MGREVATASVILAGSRDAQGGDFHQRTDPAAIGRWRPIALPRRGGSTVMKRSRTTARDPFDPQPVDAALVGFVTTVLLLVALHVLFS
jgi:hypothetical protein